MAKSVSVFPPNVNAFFSSSKHKRRCFEKCCVHTEEVNEVQCCLVKTLKNLISCSAEERKNIIQVEYLLYTEKRVLLKQLKNFRGMIHIYILLLIQL